MENYDLSIHTSKELDILEEFLEELHEEMEGQIDCYEIEAHGFGEEYKIYIDGLRIKIPSLNIAIQEGTFCNYDKENQEFVPDFSITLIYDIEETNLTNYLYWEQDGPLVTIHNYLTSKAS